MGISVFRFSSCSGCSESCQSKKDSRPLPPIAAPTPRRLPNPNPRNFAIEDVEVFGDCLLVRVKYPDCTNYEGVKIMLFHGVPLIELNAVKELDPHFCEDGISPIARFEPTDRGWELGRSLARAIVGIGY